MDIILGGAQLADSYGISNKKKGIKNKELEKIFSFKKNLRTIVDTADTYKNSIKVLSQYRKKYNLDINLKIDVGDNTNNSKRFIYKVEKNLKKLGSKTIFGIMIHDTKNFIRLNQKEQFKIISYLRKIKKIKRINNFGFSIYNSSELKYLCKIKNFDIIQLPANIFDQLLLKNTNLKLLKKRGVEIHVRSVFLQGLVFLSYKKAKKITGEDDVGLKQFYTKFKTKHLRIFHCLNFIKTQKNIGKVVIGVTSFNEFNFINKTYNKKKIKYNYEKFSINNKNITKPYNWKI